MTLWRFGHIGRLLLASAVLLTTGCSLGTLQDAADGTATPATSSNEIDESLSNTAPTADAGPDATYDAGDTVLLDGTGSTDADHDPLTYRWEQIDGSPTVEFLSNPGASMVEFVAPAGLTQDTTLTFRLTVSDGFVSDAAEVRITVQP